MVEDITARKQGGEGVSVPNKSLEECIVEHSVKLRKVNEELTEEINCCKRLERNFQRDIDKLQKSMGGVIQAMALIVETEIAYATDC